MKKADGNGTYPIQTSLFVLQKPRGGGGHCAPLAKTLLPFSVSRALEYLDFVDQTEPLDGAGLFSNKDGSAICISLPSDGGLEFSGTESKSKEKSSDGKSLTTRVTIAMIGCALLEVHVQKEMFAELGDLGDLGLHLSVCSWAGGLIAKRAIFGTSLPLSQSVSETGLTSLFLFA